MNARMPSLTSSLASSGWSYIGASGANKGYRFSDPAGAVRAVIVRAGRRIRVVGRAVSQPLGHELAADPQPVDVVLETGTTPRRYCMEFGGTTTFVADTRFSASNAGAPASCPP